MDWTVALTALVLIVPVELPDKTFVATLVLATRFRPLLVWIGVGLAFFVQTLVAVTAGGLLSRLRTDPVVAFAAVMFPAGGIILLRGAAKADSEEAETEAEFGAKVTQPATGLRAVVTSFTVLFVAEWGDLPSCSRPAWWCGPRTRSRSSSAPGSACCWSRARCGRRSRAAAARPAGHGAAHRRRGVPAARGALRPTGCRRRHAHLSRTLKGCGRDAEQPRPSKSPRPAPRPGAAHRAAHPAHGARRARRRRARGLAFAAGEFTDHYVKLLFPDRAAYPEPFDLAACGRAAPRPVAGHPHLHGAQLGRRAPRAVARLRGARRRGHRRAVGGARAARRRVRFIGPGGGYAPDPDAGLAPAGRRRERAAGDRRRAGGAAGRRGRAAFIEVAGPRGGAEARTPPTRTSSGCTAATAGSATCWPRPYARPRSRPAGARVRPRRGELRQGAARAPAGRARHPATSSRSPATGGSA